MKVKIFILALLLATVNVSVAQNILIPAGKDGKTGYVDVNGKWVINPQFENAECFSEDGFARIRQNGKIGLIDKTGKIVVEPQFYSIEGFDKIFDDNGFARFSVDTKPETQKSDDWLKDNINYDDNDDYLYGFIDKTGKIVIEAKYPFSCGFKNGLACVKLDGKYGFIDKTGKMVIENKYEYASSFADNGLALAKQNGKYGFINKSGKFVIEPQFESADKFQKCGLANIKQNDKWGCIDETGKIVIEPEYENRFVFDDNGLADVKLNDKWGFIDKTGKMVIENKYDKVIPFENHKLSLVELDFKCGFIDKTGKMVIEPQYNVFGTTYNNWSIIFESLSKKEGLLSADGEVLLKCQYDMLYIVPFSDVCLTSTKNKNGTSTIGIFYNGKHTVVKNVDWIGIPSISLDSVKIPASYRKYMRDGH